MSLQGLVGRQPRHSRSTWRVLDPVLLSSHLRGERSITWLVPEVPGATRNISTSPRWSPWITVDTTSNSAGGSTPSSLSCAGRTFPRLAGQGYVVERRRQLAVGLNYWMSPSVPLKAAYNLEADGTDAFLLEWAVGL